MEESRWLKFGPVIPAGLVPLAEGVPFELGEIGEMSQTMPPGSFA